MKTNIQNSTKTSLFDKPKKRIILVIGPPGVGKGTQCELISQKTGLRHISTGDMIRDAVKEKSELGQMVEPFLNKGDLVPDVIINDIVIDNLLRVTGEGVLLDGFPRTLSQGLALLSHKEIEIERLIILQAPESVCLKRILARKDPQRLEKDKDEKFNSTRIQFYNENLKDIFELFRGRVQIVNGNDEKDKVTQNIDKVLNEDPSKGDFNLDLLKPEVIKKIVVELCVVCMTNVADHIVVPCGHQCGCLSCLKTLKSSNDKCPICRKPIGDLIKVFKSGFANNEEETVVVQKQSLTNTNINSNVQKKSLTNNKVNLNSIKNNNNKLNKQVIPVKINTLYDVKKLENEIKVSTSLCEDLDKNLNVGIKIDVPDVGIRVPVDICCVIDVSGSMADPAKFQDPEDETKTKTDGMSILDLVKHAVKTVIHTLTDKDRFSLVSFHTKVNEEYKLSYMNDNNKKEAIKKLESLVPLDSTNIWGGLETALNSLGKTETSEKIHKRKFVFILTDGQPNISPKEGEEAALQNYLKKHPNCNYQINTFGFGYKLNSKILVGLSNIGGGVFGFIPDAKIVGTNFVNCIANAVTTLCLDAKVHLIPLGGSSFTGSVGGNVSFFKSNNDQYIVKLGNLQFGQSRDIIVPMKLTTADNYLAVILEYEGFEEGSSHKISFVANQRQKTNDSIAAYIRGKVVTDTYEILTNLTNGKTMKANSIMDALSKEVISYDNETQNDDARVNGLVADLVGFGENGGRMSKAISTLERYNRWGAHYLRSICSAHQLQLRTNFIDTGLQVYGGNTFENLQEEGGKIFIELPMIKSNINYDEYDNNAYNNNNNNNTNNNNNVNTQPVIDNTDYYGGGGGGCFDGNCLVDVIVEDKVIKTQINKVKKDDLVCTLNMSSGKTSFEKVLCVVKILLDKNEKLVEFKSTNLRLTQKHPVFYENIWQYPIDILRRERNIADLVSYEDTKTDINLSNNNNWVYNFVLETNHVVKVNDVYCVTLGHGIEDVSHPFYSTNVCVDLLKSSRDWNNGVISVNGNIKNL